MVANDTGRLIVPVGFKSQIKVPNPEYRPPQPTIDPSATLVRLQRFCPYLTFVSADQFEHESHTLLEELRADPSLVNLLKGVHFPLCLPQLTVEDYGTTLERDIIPAVRAAYDSQPLDLSSLTRKFHNYTEGRLTGNVTIAAGTRHDRLISDLAQGPIVGIWFASPMHGFGTDADVEIMTHLPERMSLSGGIDTALAFVAETATLARGRQSMLHDCAANRWQIPRRSFCFQAGFDGSLCLDMRTNFHPGESYTGGLFYR